MRPMPELKIHVEKVEDLLPYAGNAKEHPEWHVDQIARSIEEVGFNDPVGIWHNENGEMEIVEGHGRVLALKKLGIEECPCVYLDHLSDEQRKAYALIHNKLTMNTDFNFEALDIELENIVSIDMKDFGFIDLGINWDETKDFDVDEIEPPDRDRLLVCPKCGHTDVANNFKQAN